MAESFVLEHRTQPNSGLDSRSLNRRRIYILPTRNGILFAFTLLIILIGGVNYNNSLAYVLAFLLSSLTLIGLFHTYRNMAGLILTPGKPKAVFAGEMACFPILFDNRNLRSRYSLQLTIKKKPSSWSLRSNKKNDNNVIVDLDHNNIQTVFLQKPSNIRGLLKFGRLQISTSFPLGLFRAWSNIDIEESCLIYPRPLGRQPLPLHSSNDGSLRNGRQDGSDDFLGFRPYRDGDSVRNIAWKNYAREQGLQMKRFQGMGSNRLILRFQELSFLKTTEEILSQLCQWILQAEAKNYSYSLDIPGFFIKPKHGEQHKQECLRALAFYKLQ